MLDYPPNNYDYWDSIELDELSMYCERFYSNRRFFRKHHNFNMNWYNCFKAAEYVQKVLSKKYVNISETLGLKTAIRSGKVLVFDNENDAEPDFKKIKTLK